MPSLSDIQKRIRSVKNTKQITKAMEVVSATKMRKSQELALNARPYAFAAFELLASASRRMKDGKPLGGAQDKQLPVLLTGNASNKTLAVVIASDKGLAGSFNANVLRKAHALVNELRDKGSVDPVSGRARAQGTSPSDRSAATINGVDVATVGKKARDYFAFRKVPLVREFFGHGDYVDITEMQDLHDFISGRFLDSTYGRVVFVYTNFLSTLRQDAVARQVLPIKKENLYEMIEGLVPEQGKFSRLQDPKHNEPEPYLYEPDRQTVIRELTDRLFRMTLYHIQLESNASEHSARMVAMKTASENAEEIVDELSLIYNKSRQAKITQEIVEITSGSDAVN